MAAELWGPRNVAATFPIVNIVSIPGAFGSSALFGAIVEASGFEAAIFYAASMMTLSFLCIVFMQKDQHVLESLEQPVVVPIVATAADKESKEQRV